MGYKRESDGANIVQIGDPDRKVRTIAGVPQVREQEIKLNDGTVKHVTVPDMIQTTARMPKRLRNESKYRP